MSQSTLHSPPPKLLAAGYTLSCNDTFPEAEDRKRYQCSKIGKICLKTHTWPVWVHQIKGQQPFRSKVNSLSEQRSVALRLSCA